MTVLSNPAPGREQAFVDWYRGQHFRDLLAIEGVRAARLYRLADQQVTGGQRHRYLVIWEIDGCDAAGVVARIKRNMQNGATIATDSIASDVEGSVFLALTRRVEAADAAGLTAAEVQNLAGSAQQPRQ